MFGSRWENGNPLQCSCLENPRDGGAWWAAVYGVAQSWTRLKWLSSSSKIFLYSSSAYSYHFLIFSASVRSMSLFVLYCPLLLFLSFILPFFAWNVPLVSLVFLKRSLVFPILLFSSMSLHCPLRKAFLSLFAILWDSAFRWVYFSFFPLHSLIFFSQLFVRALRQPFCLFSFLFLEHDFDHHLLYNVTNLCL